MHTIYYYYYRLIDYYIIIDANICEYLQTNICIYLPLQPRCLQIYTPACLSRIEFLQLPDELRPVGPR